MIKELLNYLPKLLEKLPVSNTVIFIGIFIGLILAILLFLYFEKTFEYVKDCILKWDNIAFKRLTCFMIVPILTLICLNISIIPNENLNNWFHFLISFLMIPIFPYLFLLIFRICYLLIKTLYLKIKKYSTKNEKLL